MQACQRIERTEDFARRVGFGRAAADYGRFRAGFPRRFFEELERRGIAGAGARALDLGTGTGTIARGLAAIGLDVTGVDPSAELMAEAEALDREAGVRVTYRLGRAESIPYSRAGFELVTAGQCWHWFDRPAAAREARRVLKPGGRLVIAHFDWLPLPGNVVEATEALILLFNPGWAGMAGGSGVYPQWLADLRLGGFVDVETFSFDVDQPYSHAAWRGRIRASAGVKASLPAAKVQAFDAELAACLASRFPQEPLLVPHRVWAAIGVRASGEDR
jgi:SAM-dependent methyltransferase